MKRFNRILCVVDPQESANTAIVQSLKIANDHQADITFASVVHADKSWMSSIRRGDSNDNGMEELIANKRSSIKEQIAPLAPDLEADIRICSGIGFIEIIKTVLEGKFDLVVKCAEDTDWLARLFGSEDMHLLRKCPCPVLMLKPGQNDSFQKILATVDVNGTVNEPDNSRVQEQLNKQVLEYSAAMCMPELTEMHIGSAWEAYAEDFCRYGAFSRMPQDEVDSYVAQVKRECGEKLSKQVSALNDMLGKEAVQYLRPAVHLVKGKASREIPLMEDAYGIDLIVMGTVGRVGIPGLIIGNTAEAILEQVKCSVLAIKPEGFESPVQ